MGASQLNRGETCSCRRKAWVKALRIKECNCFVMSGKENGVILGREVGLGLGPDHTQGLIDQSKYLPSLTHSPHSPGMSPLLSRL